MPARRAARTCRPSSTSTIGAQRQENYALLAPDRETFVDLVTEGQAPAPGYFIHDATMNKKQRALMDEATLPRAMSWDEVEDALAAGALLVDGRDPVEFARGHLRGAVNVGLEGRYAEFAGSVVPVDADIVLFVEPGAELEAKNRLGRIGFDRVLGYVDRPYQVLLEHQDQAQVASRLTPVDVEDRRADLDDLQVVDVRNPGEHALGSLPERGEHPGRPAPRPTGRARPEPSHGRVLRRRLPLLRGGVAAAGQRLRRRQRHRRRLRGMDRRGPTRLTQLSGPSAFPPGGRARPALPEETCHDEPD